MEYLIHAVVALSVAVQPLIKSSVDGLKTVCLNEEVYFTCTVQDSTLISWRSPTYIPGANKALEFARGLDLPGEGKLLSFSSGHTTSLQLLAVREHELQARLSIRVFNSSSNHDRVMCFDEVQQSDWINLRLAGETIIMVLMRQKLWHC